MLSFFVGVFSPECVSTARAVCVHCVCAKRRESELVRPNQTHPTMNNQRAIQTESIINYRNVFYLIIIIYFFVNKYFFVENRFRSNNHGAI